MNEEILKVTNGRSYERLESHNLISDYGSVFIIKDSDGNYYLGKEGQPDRGAPYFNCSQISVDLYQAYKNPTADSLPRLLASNFLDGTLFEAFKEKDENLQLLNQVLENPELPFIQDYTVKSWFEQNRSIRRDANHFTEVTSHLSYDFGEIVNATNFISESLLEVDLLVRNKNEEGYSIERCVLDLEQKAIISKQVVDWDSRFLGFVIGRSFPIIPVRFGDCLQYEAIVLPYQPHATENTVLILQEATELYKYNYPKEAGLGSFWTFTQNPSSGSLQNSLLFLYSMRDAHFNTEYYILRFEVVQGKVIPKTKLITQDESRLAISPQGKVAFQLRSPGEGRSTSIHISQL